MASDRGPLKWNFCAVCSPGARELAGEWHKICRRLAAAEAVVEAARRVEWCIRAIDEGPACPLCAHAMFAGHSGKCPLGRALAAYDKARGP